MSYVGPTREQVRELLAKRDEPEDDLGDYWLRALGDDGGWSWWDLDVDKLTDAVMALLAVTQPKVRSTGAELIAAERHRQVDVEGWTPEHDAEHDRCELLHAAQNYMELGEFIAYTGRDDAARYYRGRPPREATWPRGWDWKPDNVDPVRNLVKAGALIAAEIDRLTAVVLAEGTADRALSVLRTDDERIRGLAEGTADHE